MLLVKLLLFFAVLTILYTYVGFPLLVVLRGRLLRRPIKVAPITPQVTLIVAAHNEQDSIEAKLQNVLQLDYPRDRLQVLVASDGSDDQTNEIVGQYASHGIQLLALPRLGKAGALNAAVAKAKGDVLVFSDANSMYAPDAIRQLVAPLADPTVGGVAGDQRYRKTTQAAGSDQGEHTYWNFDRQMKRWQSEAGHVISATGAIYAIRRSLFCQVPDGVTDDFITSTRVIAQGYRLVFAAAAAAYEPAAASSGVEFGRKVRVMTRGLRGVVLVRQLLNPLRYGFYSLQLFSHKVLRRLMVLPLVAIYGLSGALVFQGWPYAALFGLQSLFYGMAAVGWLMRKHSLGRHKAFALPAYFCLVNAAALVAFINILRGHRIDRWEPKRSVETAPV
ncbi:glycosyltransferase family 2 protein [Roseimaritima sediminicola]|uniref:glycosyltransferase family 2 protein n=1 Tax=Roseimaritima sediminicola TaxID=2662066 RepID=UPI00129835EB|nr:glycosyltransferase family 2 protein [Roseimaritima sediminicola]